MLPFSQHCFWQEQGAFSVGKARHCLSCLPRRTRNKKREEEMKKEETLACERAHGDRHTPPLKSSWGKQHSLSAAYHRESMHSNVPVGTVCSFLSHIWRFPADFPRCGDDLEGFKVSMLGVCFSVKKKIIKFGHSWCYIFQSAPALQGSFPQC